MCAVGQVCDFLDFVLVSGSRLRLSGWVRSEAVSRVSDGVGESKLSRGRRSKLWPPSLDESSHNAMPAFRHKLRLAPAQENVSEPPPQSRRQLQPLLPRAFKLIQYSGSMSPITSAPWHQLPIHKSSCPKLSFPSASSCLCPRAVVVVALLALWVAHPAAGPRHCRALAACSSNCRPNQGWARAFDNAGAPA